MRKINESASHAHAPETSAQEEYFPTMIYEWDGMNAADLQLVIAAAANWLYGENNDLVAVAGPHATQVHVSSSQPQRHREIAEVLKKFKTNSDHTLMAHMLGYIYRNKREISAEENQVLRDRIMGALAQETMQWFATTYDAVYSKLTRQNIDAILEDLWKRELEKRTAERLTECGLGVQEKLSVLLPEMKDYLRKILERLTAPDRTVN